MPTNDQFFGFDEMINFLRQKIAGRISCQGYLHIMKELSPRTPTGKMQERPLHDIVIPVRGAARPVSGETTE